MALQRHPDAGPRGPSAEALFTSYVQLIESLLPEVTGVALVDAAQTCLGVYGELTAASIGPLIRAARPAAAPGRVADCVKQTAERRMTMLALQQPGEAPCGVLLVQQKWQAPGPAPAAHVAAVASRLKPLLDCLRRELAPASAKQVATALTERTAELEWLFETTAQLDGASDDKRVLNELLNAACKRLGTQLAVLDVPDKNICIREGTVGPDAAELAATWEQTRKHLRTWAQRQDRPLVINGSAGPGTLTSRRCKILAVPLMRESGRSIGVLAFFRPTDGRDFEQSQIFLARHLGRQATTLVEAQFDQMTGLYTRDGIDQVYARWANDAEVGNGSVLYLDIDRLEVVNELHGFELGNELIVRVAELLTAPLLPEGAFCARISGDRFAVVLPDVEPDMAARHAGDIQAAVGRLQIGPPASPVEVSISCGVALVVIMPQGLARALAAAEIACKRAKAKGRNRVELYSCDDTTIMRRNEDIAAVAQLRSAFKADRVLLYAQRIVPLQDPDLPCSYEILMRLRDATGDLISPGPLIVAAQRYQLLPAIDRRSLEGALQALAPYRTTLQNTRISFSINVTGQSICDEDFIGRFAEQLKQSHLPHGSLSIEITEQAAVTNLARATEMVKRLSALGCRLALDDFGTGNNSLALLKSLQIARVKIDGSFIRDVLTDRRSQSTVRAIVELAKGYGIDTVAEYVETEAIATLLRKLGVDYAQGYAFSKPAPLGEVLQEISREEARKVHELFLTL